MFTELIAKECRQNEPNRCPLQGQMQDKGLPICPECASELFPITRRKDRLLALVALGATLLTGSGGLLGYGVVVQKLRLGEVAKWVMGRVSIHEDLGKQPESLLSLYLVSETKTKPDRFAICEEREGIQYCRKRTPLETGDLFHFDLTPRVDHVYLFYRGPSNPVALLPAGGLSAKAQTAMQLPQGQRLRIDPGEATESCVMVAAKSPAPGLAELAAKAQVTVEEIDRMAKPLAQQPDTLVIYLDVPHN
ncbi:MAG: hypothetical protein ACK6DY_01515 [Acidobacteriota bacterium]